MTIDSERVMKPDFLAATCAVFERLASSTCMEGVSTFAVRYASDVMRMGTAK